jgi:hypothetical protein
VWAGATLLVAVAGFIGLDRETRAGRRACVVALAMTMAYWLAEPFVLVLPHARVPEEVMLATIAALVLLSSSIRP